MQQAADEVAACRVPGNGDGRRPAGQLPAPADRQRFLAFGKKQLALSILERRLLVAKALLKRDRADLVEEGRLGILLHPRQFSVRRDVAIFSRRS